VSCARSKWFWHNFLAIDSDESMERSVENHRLKSIADLRNELRFLINGWNNCGNSNGSNSVRRRASWQASAVRGRFLNGH
jgi:hypothetical protein